MTFVGPFNKDSYLKSLLTQSPLQNHPTKITPVKIRGDFGRVILWAHCGIEEYIGLKKVATFLTLCNLQIHSDGVTVVSFL